MRGYCTQEGCGLPGFTVFCLFVLILVIELKVVISVVRQGAWLASWFARKWEQQCGDQGNLVADLSLGEFQIGLLPNKMFWSKKVETFSTCSNY